MNAEDWKLAIRLAVVREASGYPQSLQRIAQMLADVVTAKDALVGAGYGTPEDGLMDCVALVVEEKEAAH